MESTTLLLVYHLNQSPLGITFNKMENYMINVFLSVCFGVNSQDFGFVVLFNFNNNKKGNL